MKTNKRLIFSEPLNSWKVLISCFSTRGSAVLSLTYVIPNKLNMSCHRKIQ